MDFLIGVMLVFIGILLLINFTTISISDSKFGNASCNAPSNYLISTMQNNQLGGTPLPSNAGGKLNASAARVNSEFDYSKYFFVN